MGVSHPPVSRRSVGNTSKQPYFHLSACRRSSRAGIQSAIQGEWVFTRRIEDCAKPKAPGVSQAAPVALHCGKPVWSERRGTRGGGRRVCHGAPATTAQDRSSLAFLDCPVQHLQGVLLTGSEGERPASRFPAVQRRRGYAEQAGELGDRESALVA